MLSSSLPVPTTGTSIASCSQSSLTTLAACAQSSIRSKSLSNLFTEVSKNIQRDDLAQASSHLSHVIHSSSATLAENSSPSSQLSPQNTAQHNTKKYSFSPSEDNQPSNYIIEIDDDFTLFNKMQDVPGRHVFDVNTSTCQKCKQHCEEDILNCFLCNMSIHYPCYIAEMYPESATWNPAMLKTLKTVNNIRWLCFRALFWSIFSVLHQM